MTDPTPLYPAKRLAGRLALITGASRGIGHAIARAYAAQGADLILIGRTLGALEELDDMIKGEGVHATLVPLDLTDFDALDRLGASIHERWGKLDILVGNAAVLGPLTPIGHIKPKDWAELMDINITANWRLIRSLDPLLRQSDAGRAIFTSSGAAIPGRVKQYWGGYSVTKVALEMLAKTWAAETAKTALKVNMIDPGATRTAMRARAMPGEDPATLPRPEAVAQLFVDLACAEYDKTGEVIRFRETDYFTPQSQP